VAPALSSALALGEGGGSTTPEECEASVLAFAGVAAVVPVSLGDEPPVALPLSDSLGGICTFNLGRVCKLLVREGAAMVGSAVVDWVRCGAGICLGGGFGGVVPFVCGCWRATDPTSID
jgi:hypothetical protein